MTNRTIHEILDAAVPSFEDERGDWTAVLEAARPRPRRRALVAARVVPLVAALAAVASVTLAWPFDGERRTVLERALAAVGDGPVVHLVLRGSWGGALVDLKSGDVRPVYGGTEVWYDPKRGLRETSLLGGVAQSEVRYAPDNVPPSLLSQYEGVLTRYRDALKSGSAKVVAAGQVDGRPVHWIRTHGEFLPDVADGRDHLFAHEVAVDRETFEPVAFRTTRDGEPGPLGTMQAIVKLELLPDGAGDFSASPRRASGAMGGVARGEAVTLDEARGAFAGRALWLGTSFDGEPLAQLHKPLYEYRPKGAEEWETSRGLSLFYGSLMRGPRGEQLPDYRKRYVVVEMAEQLSRMWRGAPHGVELSDGSAFVANGRFAFLRRDGVYASVQALNPHDLLTALGQLRPIAGGPAIAPAVATLGVEPLARRIEQATFAPEVTGSNPVPPRVQKPKGAPVQAGSAHGVSVRIYAPSFAVFDTTGIDPAVRKQLTGRVGYSCFRADPRRTRGPNRNWAGASGELRRRYVVSLMGVTPPFDGCQLSASFGRRWGSGRSWRAPVELALTERGRRFFDERAVARELAYFVRSATMRAVRRALKREAGEPPSARALAARFGGTAVALDGPPDKRPPAGKIGIYVDPELIEVSKVAATGRRLFVELREGRIARTNARGLAFVF